MNIGIYNYYDVFNNDNNVFKKESYKIGNNLQHGAVCLRDGLLDLGHELSTVDKHNGWDKLIFYDLPPFDLVNLYNDGVELYLVLLENEMIKPDNYIKENHKYFKKVFTWDDRLVDNDKYIKIYLPNKLQEINKNNKRRFSCMVACNKSGNHKNELYTERNRIITFFERNKRTSFDLYGYGWQGLNVFKGNTNDKIETMSKYKFAYCYENLLNDYGYITEKIFDVMFSGAIPIYLGDKNITKLIPKECMIIPEYPVNYYELFDYMLEISYNNMHYKEYINNIEDYLHSDDIKIFSGENYADTIIRNINVL